MAEPPAILLGDPDELIVTTFGGKTFKGSRRTHAHLWETQRRLTIVRPGAIIRTIQPCYNTDVDASAGTHDEDAVVDTEIIGWDDWYAESDFYRSCGWADWVRDPTQGFGWHHHQASRGTPEFFSDGRRRLGIFVPGQLDDFNRHALGLKGQHDSGDDPQCFDAAGRLVHTLSPIFDYPAWRRSHEMLNDEDKAWIRTLLEGERPKVAALAAELVHAESIDTIQTGDDKGKKVSAKAALRQTSRGHREVL